MITKALRKEGLPLFGKSGSNEIRDFSDDSQAVADDEDIVLQCADFCQAD